MDMCFHVFVVCFINHNISYNYVLLLNSAFINLKIIVE